MHFKRVKNVKTELLSDNWFILQKVTFDFEKSDGNWETQSREVYDRGNGATILLYNTRKSTVVLTRQFRMPTFLNGNPDGMMIESCAGLLSGENAEDCIIRETEEETGYMVSDVRQIFEAYMSPGSVTEIIHFFIAQYDSSMKQRGGGGALDEQEDIEVLELPFEQALSLIQSGEIKDGKTIILLQYLRLEQIL